MTRRGAATANLAGTSLNTVVIAIQAIVLMPAYLRVLPTALFGAWLATSDLLNLMQSFDLGLTNVVTQRISAAKAVEDRDEVEVWFGAGTIALVFVALLIGAVAYGMSLGIASFMKLSGAQALLLSECFRFGAASVVLYLAHLSILALARGLQDTVLVNAGMVIGSAVGFAVAAGTLYGGWGLWSAAWSVAARLGAVILVDAVFLVHAYRSGAVSRLQSRLSTVVELLRVAPATASSGLAYLITSQTEGTMVAVFLRPELVPVLTLTRRGLDVAAGLLNAVSYSAYAGFAHLVGSNERSRSMWVYAEIGSLWASLAFACAAAFVAVDRSLVTVWVGEANYGGLFLACALAAQMIVTGYAQLSYYLYRATGEIVNGSMLQLYEAMLRAPLMIGFLVWLGLPGLAVGSVIAAAPCSLAARYRTMAVLRGFSSRPLSNPRIVWAVRVAALISGVWLGSVWLHPAWSKVFFLGLAMAFGWSALLVAIDTLQEPLRDRLGGKLIRRIRLTAERGIA